jgi:hypothetical protein
VAGDGKADATSAFGRDAGTVDGRAGIGTCIGMVCDASTGGGGVEGMGSRPGQDMGAGASRTLRGALGGAYRNCSSGPLAQQRRGWSLNAHAASSRPSNLQREVEDELERPHLLGTNGGDEMRDGGTGKGGNKHVFLHKTHADPLRRGIEKEVYQIRNTKLRKTRRKKRGRDPERARRGGRREEGRRWRQGGVKR